MSKGIKVACAAILAALAFGTPAGALTMSSLEKVSDDSEYIEINEPSEGYDFDANFLAKDQTLEYKATLTNDGDYPIRINGVTLDESEYDFLEYGVEGIAENDEIPVGESAEVTLSVRTNANDTQTVSEDYRLDIDFEDIIPEPEKEDKDNPETVATAGFKAATIGAISLGAVVFIFAKSKKLRHFAIILTTASLGLYMLSPNAEAEEANKFSILGKVNYTNIYSVTVDPNGGVYQGKTNKTIVSVREGEIYHVDEATRQHFGFVEWEVNPGNLDDNNDIEIHHDTTIKAKWNENTYTLIIKPNGGKYLDSEEEWRQSYRPNEPATVETPEKEGHNFANWTVEKGNIGTDGIFSGSSITMTEDVTLVANYDIKKLHVTVDPNGGTYNGEAAVFEDDVDWGSTLSLANTVHDGFDLKDWTKNGSGTLSADTEEITITEDTNLVANWWSSTFHTVTINPNGGTYDGTTEPSSYQVRHGSTYAMLEATDDNAIFDYWHYTDTDTRFSESSFVVNEDVSLTAEWLPIVARIERTQKVYASIMTAHEEANPDGITGDIITLLVDTNEIVTNSKQITLDLNYHTVYGYLNNTAAGDLILLNGEFNNYDNPVVDDTNPLGAAAINDGILTMGIDDYQNEQSYEKEPLIDNDNFRLIGSERGLIQNNEFYFYDGHIEGKLGLIGGYDGSPWYRDVAMADTVYYYPHVSRIVKDEQDYQHVQLSKANRAVSRTIVHGAIYYYDLQDNINTSRETGYDIYAVRDFDASYPLTVNQGDSIVFDITGYTVNLGETLTNSGNLKIMDSADEKGVLTSSKTITNDGDLLLENVTVSNIAENVLVRNNGRLELKNSTMTSDKAITYYAQNDNEQLIMDENSVIESKNASYPALVVGAYFEVKNGTIKGVDCTVRVERRTTFDFKGGRIESNRIAICNSGTTNIQGGIVNAESAGETVGIFSDEATVNVTGGEIYAKSTNNGAATGMRNRRSVVNVTGGTVSTEANYGTATGISHDSGSTNINGSNAKVIAKSNSDSASGIDVMYGGVTVKDGTVEVTSVNGAASGVYMSSSSLTIDGDAKIGAESTTNNAYGVQNNHYYYYGGSQTTMNSGTVTGKTKSSDMVGIGIDGSPVVIKNGYVYGSSYGLDRTSAEPNMVATLGINDADLHNGQDGEEADPIIEGGLYGIYDAETINFYDGMIKGGVAYIKTPALVKAVPDGARRVVDPAQGDEDTEDCWLELEQPFLRLESNGREYSAFNKIYEDAQDTDTITVIRDIQTEAVIPNNTKNITFDLDSHVVRTSLPFYNAGTMTIKDGRTGGEIIGLSSSAIVNDGTLNMLSGKLYSAGCTVSISKNHTFNMIGGLVESPAITICNSGAVKVSGGVVKAEGSNANVTAIQTYSNSNLTEVSGGEVIAKATGGNAAVGISNRDTAASISGGTVSAEAVTGSAIGISSSSTELKITGANTKVSAKSNSNATGIEGSYGVVNLTDGTIKVESGDLEAIGINSNATDMVLNGNATIEVESTASDASGIKNNHYYYYAYGSITMNGGTISGKANSSERIGIGIDSYGVNVKSGYVYGSSYGINRSGQESIVTLGTNDNDLHNGQDGEEADPIIEGVLYGIYDVNTVNFYDGIIRGGVGYIKDENFVKSVPDGAHRVVDAAQGEDDTEDCWLEFEQPFLRLESNGREYNNFTNIYADAQDTDTITVTRDISTQSTIPSTGNKNITLDLDSHAVEFTQPIINEGTMTIKDSRTGGSITNLVSGAVINRGSLSLVSGSLLSNNCTITNEGGKSFSMSGGRVESRAMTICNQGRLEISGGTIHADGTNSGGDLRAIHSESNSANINISGGNISVIATGNRNATAVNSSSGEVTVTGGAISVDAVSGAATGINSSNGTLRVSGRDTSITVNKTDGGAYDATGIYKGSGDVYVTDSKVSVKSTYNKSLGVYLLATNAYIDGEATITSENTNGDAFGIQGEHYYYYANTNVVMTNGTITSRAGGIGTGIDSAGVTVTNGKVYGSNYGIDREQAANGTSLVLGKKETAVGTESPEVEGGNYGVYMAESVQFYDGVVKGGVDAFGDIRDVKRIADNTNIHDEVISGVDNKYLVAEDYVAKIGSGNCGDAGTECYMTIAAAVDASNTGDTVTLLRDDYIFYDLTFPAGKSFTLDLAGYTIITGNPIVNNSDLTIINSGAGVTIDYVEGGFFITNNSGAKLAIGNNITITSPNVIKSGENAELALSGTIIGDANTTQYAIESYGKLTVENATVNATTRAIYQQTGDFTITNSKLNAYSVAINIYNASGSINEQTEMTVSSDSRDLHYALQLGGGDSEVTINKASLKGAVVVSAGTLNMKESSVTYRLRDIYQVMVSNAGTMTADACSFTIDGTGGASNTALISNESTGTFTVTRGAKIYDYDMTYGTHAAVRNSGEMTIGSIEITRNSAQVSGQSSDVEYGIQNENSGTLTVNKVKIRTSNANSVYAIYSNGGDFQINEADIELKTNINNTYGIYSAEKDDASVTLKSGTIKLNGVNAYGVWARRGAITLGEAEPLDSPNRGTANANVSVKDPYIEAIGSSTGYAVTIEGGRFNFYDGKLAQNEQGYPAYQADHTNRATISNVEYWYEPEVFSDGAGHYYYVLTYMPQP